MDHRVCPKSANRDTRLCALYPGQLSERQNWLALSERRWRQGLSRRLEGRTWRKSRWDAGRRGFIRACGSDGRLAGCAAEGGGCRSAVEYGVAEIRCPGDQEGGRTRLEAGSSSRCRLILNRRRSGGRRSQQFQGTYFGEFVQGSQ